MTTPNPTPFSPPVSRPRTIHSPPWEKLLSPALRADIRGRTYPDADFHREEIMNAVRDALYEFGDMQMLSNRTGVSVSCLHSIRSGRTKWPRPTTLFTILPYLGLRLSVVKCEARAVFSVSPFHAVHGHTQGRMT